MLHFLLLQPIEPLHQNIEAGDHPIDSYQLIQNFCDRSSLDPDTRLSQLQSPSWNE